MREDGRCGRSRPPTRTPWYGTWDHHDFGSNDTDGRLKSQSMSRRAFVEYHANPSYGDGEREMIWNDAVRPNKLDHWGSYPYERDAVFRFLGDEKIGGVSLIGGDVHGLVVSPMHDGIIATANSPHPGLLKDMGEPRMILMLEASQREDSLDALRARFVNAAEEDVFVLNLVSRKGR